MRIRKYFSITLLSVFVVALLQITAVGQEIAGLSSQGSSVRFDLRTASTGGTLVVSAPDGRVFRQEFKAGGSPELLLTDSMGERLPDGAYSYEIRLNPDISPALREKLKAMRGKDNEPEAVRAARKRPVVTQLVQSGGFSILNGAVMVPGPVEEKRARPVSQSIHPQAPGAAGAAVTKMREHHVMPKPDFVIADDLVVQGSACVGLDCVNNEPFSFDTIRLKENNTRILFMDTSVGTFPTNDWMIRANSSANGGTSFLGFVDQGATSTGSDTGTIVFEVDAGAPSNALRVSSTGNVGLSTGTPVLDLHIATGDTPAERLEQTNAGGFTAQTWDIAGNEANFFVRDVTGGSLLPFRIRPGAPTSSIDISADGDVGVGTASPAAQLHVLEVDNNSFAAELEQTNPTASNGLVIRTQTPNAGDTALHVTSNSGATLVLSARNNGRVGIGTGTPDQLLSVNGNASKVGGGSWLVFSDKRLKTVKGNFSSGLSAVMQLQPIRFMYKPDNALGLKSEREQVGFEAQALQEVIPAAVTQNDKGYLMVNNDPIIFSMLNAIKEQQKQIEELQNEVRRLKATSRRRR